MQDCQPDASKAIENMNTELQLSNLEAKYAEIRELIGKFISMEIDERLGLG